MATLGGRLKPNCAVHGVLPNAFVPFVSVQVFRSGVIELTYKDATDREAEAAKCGISGTDVFENIWASYLARRGKR